MPGVPPGGLDNLKNKLKSIFKSKEEKKAAGTTTADTAPATKTEETAPAPATAPAAGTTSDAAAGAQASSISPAGAGQVASKDVKTEAHAPTEFPKPSAPGDDTEAKPIAAPLAPVVNSAI